MHASANCFWLNEVDFGIGEIQFGVNKLENTLTLEVSADQAGTERISADNNAGFGWLLYPPKLYFRDVPFEQIAGTKRIVLDEQLLDAYDIALYILEHYDVVGTATFTESQFVFTGHTQLDGTKTTVVISCLLPQ